MRRLAVTLTAALLCGAACERFSLPQNDYQYFAMTAAPEERMWYPEEELIFTFNQPVDTATLAAVTFSYEGDPVHETVAASDGERLIVTGLLPDATLTVTIGSGLKSLEHKPLVAGAGDGSATGPLAFSFTIGPALPQVAQVVPGDDIRSRAVVLRFTGAVTADSLSVTPSPRDLRVRDDLLLLSFSTPPSTVTVSGLAAAARPGTLPAFTLHLTEEAPAADEPSVAETATDTAVTLSITGSGLVAAMLDDELALCDPGCTLTRTGLAPDTGYTFDITLYRTDGEVPFSHTAHTLAAAPHVMVSEVMHTPEGSPEKNYEFIEVYNYGDLDFDLAGCTVDDRGDGVGEDTITPLLEGDTAIAPGEFALILGAESALHLDIAAHPHVFFVDDTTIADGGLTSTESVEINCPGENGSFRVASYNGLFRGASRGYSVVLAPDGRVCASAKTGGSPGAIEWCPE